jgi:hypothetical protein
LLRAELNKVKLALSEGEAAAVSQRAEIGKLTAVIAEADAERLRQRKEWAACWLLDRRCA